MNSGCDRSHANLLDVDVSNQLSRDIILALCVQRIILDQEDGRSLNVNMSIGKRVVLVYVGTEGKEQKGNVY